MSEGKIRLYVDQPLGAGQAVRLSSDQAHYLVGVMRLAAGAVILLFNGRDGEWRASLAEAGKRGAIAVCEAETHPQSLPPDLWLVFAPIKKARTDFIVEKAVELGVRRILPVQTRHTNSERIRQDRLQAHAVEAAEQCRATFVPEVAELAPLDRLLRQWPEDRCLYWCDEAAIGQPAEITGPAGPAAILIGPEGGFSADEAAKLRGMPNVAPLSLGPRIRDHPLASPPRGLEMSFIRPELIAATWRHAEVILGVGLAALGLWMASWGGYLYLPFGLFLLVLGLGWALTAWRRLQFQQRGDAPGLVRVTEAQIAYYGTRVGGFVGLPDLAEIRLLTLRGRRIWKLKQGDGQLLHIPVEALGAEALFDAFAALPGMDTAGLVAALGSEAVSDSRVVALAEVDRLIWARKGAGVVVR
jgi:16S rRNA (uracil1498-N3)-methyltransferase